MNENSYFPNFNDEDVIQFDERMLAKIDRLRAGFSKIINEFSNFIAYNLREHGIQFKMEKIDIINNNHEQNWVVDNCQVLKLGASSWQKGKIKISLKVEFIPDEPEKIESPLDDIRQAINAERENQKSE